MDVLYRNLKQKLFILARLTRDRAGSRRWGEHKEDLVSSKLLKSSLLQVYLHVVVFCPSMKLMPSNHVASYHSSCLSFIGTEASGVEVLHK